MHHRGARSWAGNGHIEDLPPPAEQEHREADIQRPGRLYSAGCGAPLRRSACSPDKPRSADAHRPSLRWTALGAGRCASQFALSPRAYRLHAPEVRMDRVQASFSLSRQSQTYASPIRLRWLSDQVPTRLKQFDGLGRGTTGGRLKLRQCGWIPGEAVGAGEKAERRPLRRTEFAIIALSLYESSHLHQKLCRLACAHGHLTSETIVAFRNQIDNGLGRR
jgi:hypothetical protein